MTDHQTEKRPFLPLGSIVVLRGAVKKVMIVARGSIVENRFFDYGAILYPEGMVDANIAYFDHDDIVKIVHEGYVDEDDQLVLDLLNDAHAQFQQQQQEGEAAAAVVSAASSSAGVVVDDDPFASVRDMADDDE